MLKAAIRTYGVMACQVTRCADNLTYSGQTPFTSFLYSVSSPAMGICISRPARR